MLVGGFVVLATAIGLPPLLLWQRQSEERAISLSNLRRLSLSLLLYSQDWDGRLMPPTTHAAYGSLVTWPTTLAPYVAPESVFDNPANPLPKAASALRDPADGYPIRSGYALNRRFWNTFSPGPFAVEDLEIPTRTAMLVEAGPMWRDPLQRDDRSHYGVIHYGDMLDRSAGYCPYPSSHEQRAAVSAADGHAVTLHVEHYSPASGPHDRLYGRIGANIYNWNGGHPNGQTDRPARE